MLFSRLDCGRIFGNNTFYDSTMFVDNKYRKEYREISNKITASLIGQAGMLVNVYVETFKIDVMVFVGKVTMNLMSQQFSVSDSVCDNDMTAATLWSRHCLPFLTGHTNSLWFLVGFVLFDL